MTEQGFVMQMARLERQFNSKFGEERGKILWREVKDLSDAWFVTVIDKLLGECRYMPMVIEFREEISRERERVWRNQKKANAKDARDFYAGNLYQADDTRTICKTIVSRLLGNVLDAEYSTFQQLLENASGGGSRGHACWTCGDSGVFFDSESYAFKCSCPAGRKRTEAYPVHQSRFQAVGGGRQ
jgi:hypothetical protein